MIYLILLLLPQALQAETRRNYEGVKSFLQRVVAENSTTTKTFVLGPTDSRDSVLGVRIGSGATKNLVVATHHGNEYGSTEVALAVMEDMAKNPIPGQTIFVIPVLNIAGYNKRQRNEVDQKGISRDPNRDYPGPCGTEGPFTLKSTKLLADFISREGIVNSATLHTHYPAVMYPWGLSSRDIETPYTELFRKLATDATIESRYPIGNSTEVLYPADGTFEDYAYWKHGVWSILFELGFSHSPTESQIETMIEINVPGIRRMLAQAPTQKAPQHAFNGRCEMRLKALDRHDE